MASRGIGLSPEEFGKGLERGVMAGYTGFEQSIHMMASSLGIRIEKNTRPADPIISRTSGKTACVDISPGQVAGRNHRRQHAPHILNAPAGNGLHGRPSGSVSEASRFPAVSGEGRAGNPPPFLLTQNPSTLRTTSRRTSTPASRSPADVFSSGLWLTPPMLGTKIMAALQTPAIIWAS